MDRFWSNFEEWKMHLHGRRHTIHHYSETCSGSTYAEIFEGVARCFQCGESVPDEFVFIAELAGAFVPNYTGIDKGRFGIRDMETHWARRNELSSSK